MIVEHLHCAAPCFCLSCFTYPEVDNSHFSICIEKLFHALIFFQLHSTLGVIDCHFFITQLDKHLFCCASLATSYTPLNWHTLNLLVNLLSRQHNCQIFCHLDSYLLHLMRMSIKSSILFFQLKYLNPAPSRMSTNLYGPGCR